MELNIWMSTTVVNASQDPVSKKWFVLVRREDNSERTFTVNHLVFATGIGGGRPKIPSYPGSVRFFLYFV
jgi:cation diffusion facilitator CzcD-associated flavoprotein CzcO